MIKTYIVPEKYRDSYVSSYSRSRTATKIDLVESTGFSVVTYSNGDTETVPNESLERTFESMKIYLKPRHRHFKSEGGIADGIKTFLFSWFFCPSYFAFMGTAILMAWATCAFLYGLLVLIYVLNIAWLAWPGISIAIVTLFAGSMFYGMREV